MEVKIWTKNLKEPWFSFVKLGYKNVERRLRQGDFANMHKDDIIHFTNDEEPNNPRFVDVVIDSIERCKDFTKFLEGDTLKRCLPGVQSIKDGLAIYHHIYPLAVRKGKEVLAIRISLIRGDQVSK